MRSVYRHRHAEYVEKGIVGGITQKVKRYVKANIKYVRAQ